MEGSLGSRSRAPSPLPGTMGPTAIGMPNASPNLGFDQQQLAAPEGFSRPINAACPYTPFEALKIQGMDSFLEHIPRMPAVLQPHDVYIEDWARFVQVCVSVSPSAIFRKSFFTGLVPCLGWQASRPWCSQCDP